MCVCSCVRLSAVVYSREGLIREPLEQGSDSVNRSFQENGPEDTCDTICTGPRCTCFPMSRGRRGGVSGFRYGTATDSRGVWHVDGRRRKCP